MSESLRCPACGGTNAFCNGKPTAEHNHSCAECGYQVWPSPPDLEAALADLEENQK